MGILNDQFLFMGTDVVHIMPSDKTPEVFLNPEGIIKISGRGLSVHRTEVTDQILDWVEIYLKNPAETTYVLISFEYLNSLSTTMLFTIIKKITQVLLQSGKLVIRWYYEEDDEDILERGEYLSAALNIPIEFLITHKSAGI
jgi:hypothetical protein